MGVNMGVNTGVSCGNNQIFFRLSLAHFDELESDRVKYRGNYRQTISALKILSRYNFTSVLSIQNFYKLSELILKENFARIFEQNDITNTDLQINVSYPNHTDEDVLKPAEKTDCMYGRILTKTGIYACPFLSNDYRGRTGSDFTNYSKTVRLETPHCISCINNKEPMFSVDIDW